MIKKVEYKKLFQGKFMDEYFEFPEGGIWELKDIRFLKDYVLAKNDKHCRHVIAGILPLALQAFYGQNKTESTCVCVHCIRAAYTQLLADGEIDG